MMRQSEFKMKYDPELGRYIRQHIYGDGITDVFKSFGSKLFEIKTIKTAAKKGAEKAVTTAATKTGEYAVKKAGDKIVKVLSKRSESKKVPKKVTFNDDVTVKTIPKKKLTDQEINQRVSQILSGGAIRKRKLYNY